jgi:thiamine biosynthesis lipoprotein
VRLNNAALATSGDYRKFKIDEETGIKYAHTINPKTGYPAKSRLISVTIVTDNAMAADAWATACMVMGLDEAKKLVIDKKLDAYFIFSNLNGKWQIWQTEGFQKISI